jgi:hypothetical protein
MRVLILDDHHSLAFVGFGVELADGGANLSSPGIIGSSWLALSGQAAFTGVAAGIGIKGRTAFGEPTDDTLGGSLSGMIAGFGVGNTSGSVSGITAGINALSGGISMPQWFGAELACTP